MLKATFQCLGKIRAETELRLWEDGCLCWDDLKRHSAWRLSSRKQAALLDHVDMAEAALDAGMADWFLNRLKGAAKLRVANDFIRDALYLDIETTGMGIDDEVTCVGTWKNGCAKCFVRGINLTDFMAEVAAARLLVTYNGDRFDLPFLRKCFGIGLALPHLDLMYPLRALGCRGGLKACEKQLGFKRVFSAGQDGREAIRLWDSWNKCRVSDDLRHLVRYNIEDAYSLAWLTAKTAPYTMANYPLGVDVRLPPPPNLRNLDNLAL